MSPRPEADVLYTSDLHGHEPLYREMLDVARRYRVRAIVLGGDLAPHADPPAQSKFYRSFLLPLLREYLAEPGSADVTYIFGNDDWRVSGELLVGAGLPRLRHAHGQVLPFLDGTFLAGLASVPITPFDMKDWDRWEDGLPSGARMDGVRSVPGGGLAPFDFRGREEAESLARELQANRGRDPPGRAAFLRVPRAAAGHRLRSDRARNARRISRGAGVPGAGPTNAQPPRSHS